MSAFTEWAQAGSFDLLLQPEWATVATYEDEDFDAPTDIGLFIDGVAIYGTRQQMTKFADDLRDELAYDEPPRTPAAAPVDPPDVQAAAYRRALATDFGIGTP